MRFGKSHAPQDAPLASTHFAPAPHVIAAVHDTDTALLDMRAERYYTLDAVGTRIWELLHGGHSVDEIAMQLAAEYDAPFGTIATDVRVLCAKLHAASLVIPSDRAGEP